MSKDQVKGSETVELQAMAVDKNGPDVLGGTSSVDGMPCMILYQFADNQLVSAAYQIPGKTLGTLSRKRHTNDNVYLDDFETIRRHVATSMGNP
jgi:hypothetical protein